MRRVPWWVCTLLLWPGLLSAQDATVYEARRARLLAQLPDGVALIRNSPGQGADEFQHNKSFFYLTGLTQENAALLLAPQGIRIHTRVPGRTYYTGELVKEILFVHFPTPYELRWVGGALGVEALRQQTGIYEVMPVEEIKETLTGILQSQEVFYLGIPQPPGLDRLLTPDLTRLEEIRQRFFWLDLKNLTPLVDELRRVKSPQEIQKIQRAVDLIGEGIQHVLQETRPGMRESEAEALIEYTVRRPGAKVSFGSIVAAGRNATVLHYRENREVMDAGELVVLDVGAEVEGYASDVTRTFPISGKFSPRQHELYTLVLQAQEAGFRAVKPGATLEDVHRAAYEVIEQAGYGKSFVHGTSHYLGLDVHDVGDRLKPFEPGVVLTVEPGIYLPEEGIGIRVEDDVAVTPDGYQLLSRRIPRTIAEIEATMKK